MLKNFCTHCGRELNVLKIIKCIRAVLNKEPNITDEKLCEIDDFCDDTCFNDYLAKKEKELNERLNKNP